MTNTALPLSDRAAPLPQEKPRLRLADQSIGAQDAVQAELIELYQGIEQCVGGMMRPGMLVQFVSYGPKESCEEIAMALATTASDTLGKRILLIDGSIDGTACGLRLPENNASLADQVHSTDDVGESLIKLRGREHYVARLRSAHDHRTAFAVMSEIARLLDKLRATFDMTIVVAPPADLDPLFSLMAPQVDGTILVVAAERTQRRSVAKLNNRVARAGGKVIGSILSQRRSHVPRWLESLF